MLHRLSTAAAAPTAISPLSLHDALPISARRHSAHVAIAAVTLVVAFGVRLAAAESQTQSGTWAPTGAMTQPRWGDRKSTRLNSSHLGISYAVFCLKKKSSTPSRRYTTAS